MRNVKVYWFNVGLEEKWDTEYNWFRTVSNRKMKETVWGMEQVLLCYAEKDDLIFLRREPSKIVLNNVEKVIGYMPNFHVVREAEGYFDLTQALIINSEVAQIIEDLKIEAKVLLCPYMINEEVVKFAEKVQCRYFGATPDAAKMYNSKICARNITKKLCLPVTNGIVKSEISKIEDFGKNILEQNKRIVIKKEYGASAKGISIISSKKEFDRFINQLKKADTHSFKLIIEQWYENAININYQILVDKQKGISLIGLTEQIVKEGVYLGCIYYTNLFSEWHRKQYENYAHLIGNYLYKNGYEGIISIDSIIDKEDVIYPIIEINARFSLSTYISRFFNIIGNDRFYFTRYFNLYTKYQNDKVMNIIKKYPYNSKERNGIAIYSYSPYIDKGNMGRVFFLVVAKDIKELRTLQEICHI